LKSPSDYNRLPGSSNSSLGFGRNSLWLGEDHVLLLQRRGYVEDYKRFYFKDIHAVVIRKTGTFFVVNIIFGVFLLSCLLLHYLGLVVWEWDAIGHSLLGIWTLLFLIILGINALKGPTCATSLHTAVHSESITSMSRIRSSLRAMNVLRRKIEEVQGHLSEEILVQHPGIQAPPLLIPPPVKGAVKNVVSDYKGNVHLALFTFLLVDAILTALSIFNRSKVLLIIGTVSSAVLWLLIMISLIKQRHGDLPRTVTGLTWGVLIYGAVYYAFSYFFFMVIAMQDPSMGTNQWDWMKKMWEISPLDHPGLLFLSIFSITCSLVLGIPGVIALLRLRARGRINQEEAIAGGEAS
jgi:hypothetical protein